MIYRETYLKIYASSFVEEKSFLARESTYVVTQITNIQIHKYLFFGII